MKTILRVLILLICMCTAEATPREVVAYEAFGAVGDGVADDLPAIRAAHIHANEHGLLVRSNPDATYHLGRRALTVIIATDTDWSTSRFTIDDTDVENHKKPLFEVRSLLKPETLEIDRLTRDQKRVNARPERDCFVTVENKNKRIFIRRGLNQNSGSPLHDCFILRKDGSIESPIDWDYEEVTWIIARPIDENTLTLRGGVFTTIANRTKQKKGYNYWSRNIVVKRSNTVVENLTHYVEGETDIGHPYSGFINVRDCAEITLRDCFATGHKRYTTIGSAGKPVSMGSYDYSMNNVVNLRMIRCRMDHILDRSKWGVIGSNFCKNILLEDCELSRMDAHQGVSGSYTIRGCTLGHMGLNAIGRGLLTVEDSTLYGWNLVNFRSDYGSTWEGDLVIRNCRWIPARGAVVVPYMIGASNDGTHDFGYPCSMPRHITIDNLTVEDTNVPKDYEGMYFFANHDPGGKSNAARPFPYQLTKTITVRGLKTASGKKPRISPNATVRKSVVVTEKN
ncbi:hypothetical protein [Pontiella sulfatireligans]|uniref:Pectate lyase superfamily protein domain-containing protein n=1 Tax=Pontiella sulfatireligans TaxID=2750658 RepID=A0A6C2UGH3_9BACT|nr:hypothetical protein [Pontiella sulfatireligans]VGO19275.1 hypothetical protein SCARR_01333 [Pontiella sulfatireligans]